jgi:PAS domain S-box-containing protein
VCVNPAFERLTGYTAAEFMSRHLKELTGPSGRDRRHDHGHQGRARRDLVGGDLPQGGSSFWSEMIVAPVRGEDGRATHFVWLLNDASARKQAERQAETIARTEKLRALGQMATGIAHDLNRSLMLIAGYSELAREELEQDELDIDDLRDLFGIVEPRRGGRRRDGKAPAAVHSRVGRRRSPAD